MKKYQRYNSCKGIPEDVKDSKAHSKEMLKPELLAFKELEIEETPSEAKFSLSVKSETLAQRIPKLPESKFFPTNGRNINVKLNMTNPSQVLSANNSSTQICNNSGINYNNLSLQHKSSKDSTINFSQFSQMPEQVDQSPKWTDMSLPSAPILVLGKFKHKLSSYEQAEILKYPLIWCIGIDSKKPESNGNSTENYGFDDESGDYKVVVHDHIAYRYEIHEVLGRGSFGQVFRVFDFKHKVFCALKIIKNKKRFNQQAMVEVDILRHLRKHDEQNMYNIVHIQSSFNFRNHIVRYM